jgi:hypothetical protein
MIEQATLYYCIKNKDWVKTNFQPPPHGSALYSAKAIIPPDKITLNGLYYYIWTTDAMGNISSTTIQKVKVNQKTTSPKLTYGSIKVPDGNEDDGSIILDIPLGALKEKISITITQKDAQNEQPATENTIDLTKNQAKPVALYTLEPMVIFKNPARLTLLYFDLEGENGNGYIDVDETIDENKLRIYLWDGINWRYLGGKVDPYDNTVTSKITRLGKYALFAVGSTGDGRAKEKFITPKIHAFFEGAEEVKIFTTKGREILTLRKDEYNTTIIWNGKDERGNQIESGLYIYKTKTHDGNIKWGTVIITR